MKQREALIEQHSGASSLERMGTTGLVSWVLSGETGNRWERFRRARWIIDERGLSVSLFCCAILATGHRHGINLRRFARAAIKRHSHIPSIIQSRFIP